MTRWLKLVAWVLLLCRTPEEAPMIAAEARRQAEQQARKEGSRA